MNADLSFVSVIARRVMARLPSSVQLDDLMQSGALGLFEAAEGYDSSRGASFKTYASIRIRGAMLDEVRRSDWTPRSVHRNARRVSEAVRLVENREGREAQSHEVAEELGVEIEEYQRMVSDSVSSRVMSFEDVFEPGSEGENRLPGREPDPADLTEKSERWHRIAVAVGRLPERERKVIDWRYGDELEFAQIGKIMGVHATRAHQLHSSAIKRIRNHLNVKRHAQ